MGEGNNENDGIDIVLPDPGTPHRWEQYDTEDLECSPQSLLGYGKKAHQRSGGVCLYCGYGGSWQVEPEIKFDAWRQLTVEHIVPSCKGQLDRDIKNAVAAVFQVRPMDHQRKIIHLVKDLNEVTSCHLCNSMASRCTSRNYIGEAINLFGEHLQADAAGGIQQWIEQLRRDIWEVWHFKSDLVRAKLMVLRNSFEKKIGPALQVSLAGTRPLPTPLDLDNKLKHIMDSLINTPLP